jgi:HAD superfamily phosphoserine phosphatase-like hydrolase
MPDISNPDQHAFNKKYLILDVDGTLISQHASLIYFNQLAEHSPPIREVVERAKPLYNTYKQRNGSFQRHLDVMSEIWDRNLHVGIPAEIIQIAAQETARHAGARMYAFVRELLKVAKMHGYRIVFVSGSPIEVVRELTKTVEPDHIFATTFPLDAHGAYADGPYVRYGKHKQRAIDALNSSEHPIEYTTSVAIGDTENDLSLFEGVRFPICFQPTGRLMERLKDEGYPYVVETRDVLHIMKAFVCSEGRVYTTVGLTDILPPPLGGELAKVFRDLGWFTFH